MYLIMYAGINKLHSHLFVMEHHYAKVHNNLRKFLKEYITIKIVRYYVFQANENSFTSPFCCPT